MKFTTENVYQVLNELTDDELKQAVNEMLNKNNDPTINFFPKDGICRKIARKVKLSLYAPSLTFYIYQEAGRRFVK